MEILFKKKNVKPSLQEFAPAIKFMPWKCENKFVEMRKTSLMMNPMCLVAKIRKTY